MTPSTVSYLISAGALVGGGALIYSGMSDNDQSRAKIKEIIGSALLFGGVSIGIAATVKTVTKATSKEKKYLPNPAKLCPSNSRIQSLIFPKDFGVSNAKRWARKHGFKAKKVDVTMDSIRIRQEPPSHFERMRTISMGHGIRGVIGWPRC